jgi:hypothetical protein
MIAAIDVPPGWASKARTASCFVPLRVARGSAFAGFLEPFVLPRARLGFCFFVVFACAIVGTFRLRRHHQAPSPPKPRIGPQAGGAAPVGPKGPIRAVTLTLRSKPKSSPYCQKVTSAASARDLQANRGVLCIYGFESYLPSHAITERRLCVPDSQRRAFPRVGPGSSEVLDIRSSHRQAVRPHLGTDEENDSGGLCRRRIPNPAWYRISPSQSFSVRVLCPGPLRKRPHRSPLLVVQAKTTRTSVKLRFGRWKTGSSGRNFRVPFRPLRWWDRNT